MTEEALIQSPIPVTEHSETQAHAATPSVKVVLHVGTCMWAWLLTQEQAKCLEPEIVALVDKMRIPNPSVTVSTKELVDSIFAGNPGNSDDGAIGKDKAENNVL